MNSSFYSLSNCASFLEELNINPHINALWDILHIARWHKGIDWVMWINNNKELVKQITQYSCIVDIPEEFLSEIWDTVLKIKRIDK